MNRVVNTYIIDGREIDIVEVDTEDGQDTDYYDIFEGGNCLNEGSPFYEFPTVHRVTQWLNEN